MYGLGRLGWKFKLQGLGFCRNVKGFTSGVFGGFCAELCAAVCVLILGRITISIYSELERLGCRV